MKLLRRNRPRMGPQVREWRAPERGDSHADNGPQPQPERLEPTLEDPGLRDLSKRDYVAILKRAGKKALEDNVTDMAAALAYYSFLAIPAVLLLAVGVFTLVASPD